MPRYEFPAAPDELWWGGCSQDGLLQPFGFRRCAFDQATDNNNNQAAPVLLSTQGRYLWSDAPLNCTFHSRGLTVETTSPLHQGRAANGLRGAYRAVAKKFFPPSGKAPPREFFTLAQFNTWIELTYDQSQERILDYARGILDHGFDPGILMIDDGWQRAYGDWHFRADRFSDPGSMVAELKRQGFRTMLWVVPFITADTPVFRDLQERNLLLRDTTGATAIRNWWNGYSAVLDLTHPDAIAWMRGELNRLKRDFGVDGFKFDAGDFTFYRADDLAHGSATPAAQCEAWARLGAEYNFNEFRACWKMGNQPLVQRLWDKAHSWHENGLAALIPNSIAQGLIGHAFTCPDMIGGGEFRDFAANADRIDQELVVRMAQCSALMPMMQFSAAPWRILDDRHLACCRAAAALHARHGPRFWRLARHAARTGEPILRALAYEYPDSGYERITDQFMVGSDLLVAPVLQRGADSRRIVLPPGKWRDDQAVEHLGPKAFETATNLERLPYFVRQSPSTARRRKS